MSTALLAAIAVILCILFRILNVNSQPQKPSIWCGDHKFLDTILKISPLIQEPIPRDATCVEDMIGF
ncbi:hypothetical protein GEV33_004908 [Tenebrio molitor]|uniref:Uncharacterized protein n=1 Tax=Tenebrio molitor TaxID=7067 RepID=A0A8J6LFZ1_TENMO|nr:hypothetical protein GEV33_004908 [Tenebrio molitor]